MKKKLLAILAAFVAVTPLAAVNAEDFDYSLGHEHNFIVNKQQEDEHASGKETVGIKIISLGDDPEDSGYVLGLAKGANTFHGPGVYGLYTNYTSSTMPTKFEDSISYQSMLEDFNGSIYDNIAKTYGGASNLYDTALTTPYVRNFNTNSKMLRLPTKDEVLSWFAHDEVSSTKYTLTSAGLEKFKSFYEYALVEQAVGEKFTSISNTGHFVGFVLGDDPVVENNDIYMWVIKSTVTLSEGPDGVENAELTSVTIERVSNNASVTNKDIWIMVPILSFNKTYNCKFDTTKKTACFKCGDDYQWLVVGEQASTCSIVSGVTSKAKCVKNPPTGVEDYILEFAIAAGICGIVLFAVKRKSLFSRV